MSAYQACVDVINKAAGRELTDEEMHDLLASLQARERYLQAKGMATDSRSAALQAAEDVANNIRLAAVIEKRNAALNLTKRLEKVAFVQRNFGHNPAEGLEAIMVGVNRAKQGAKEGASQIQHALREHYFAGFGQDLESTGHLSIFSSGALDREISRALFAIGRDDEAALHAQLPDAAVSLARVIHKWQEIARLDANEAGAWVGKEAGYITRQAHDPEKILRAGYDEWRKAALQHFDLARMGAENAGDVEGTLHALWLNLSSGNHLKNITGTPDKLTGFKGPANLAKKVSQGRVIHFKDADAWFDYNTQFGNRNLRESVASGLRHSADSTGLMRALGTNPQAMIDTIRDDLILWAKEQGKPELVTKLQSKRGRLDNFMSVIDGSINIPGNAMAARYSANIRSWQMMAKLGGMIMSQLNDIAVYGSGARYQGRGFMSGMGEAVAGLGRNMKDQDTRELAASLGVALDNMVGEMGRIGSFAEAGSMSRMTQLFMKLNLGEWWTSRMRTSAAFGMAHHMALQTERDWAHLNPDYQRVLSLYNITPEKWDVIRQTAIKEVNGKAFVLPEHLHSVDDAAIESYLRAAGENVSPDSIASARREIEQNLRTFLSDQTTTLALEPDTKVKAIMLQGTRPGTITGELMRFLMQFKSFTGAYMQRIIGRELFGKGYEGDSIIGALRAGNGEFQGLVQLIVTSTLLGYGSMALKDLAKGKTPRDPTESPEAAGKILLAAMVQGGGAGIYGDFLFGAASRMGGGTVETAAGPTISTLGRFIDLYHKAIAGDHFAANVIRETINNTPFLNLFYLRIALDYGIFYRMQESMSPGYLRRVERDAEQNNAQHFLIKPSEVVK